MYQSMYGKVQNFDAVAEFDYSLFIVWEDAKEFIDDIREKLNERFNLLLDASVEWSDKYFIENACRLYEIPINDTDKVNVDILNKIGTPKFHLFMIQDVEPHYTYLPSVSGKVELSNTAVVAAKYEFREWVKAKTGKSFSIHSTNNISEFHFQAPLLLGLNLYEKIINNEKQLVKTLQKDLEGAGSWNSYKELFDILNVTTNYLVQRSFETLPFKNEELDIDFLTDSYQRLASAIGCKQDKKHPYKGVANIENNRISIDMRYVGDNYYNTIWSERMLRRKINCNGVFTPRIDDFFFSLLFHCKVQKASVKEKYITQLNDIAKILDFDWFNKGLLKDDLQIAKLLNGYYRSEGYFFELPIDREVYTNKKIAVHLPQRHHGKKLFSFKNTLKSILVKFARKVLSNSAYKKLVSTYKKF
ncbi:hypothetical protein [Marinobacter sp. AL4B]|uniref:hypothetical protein n=1 Tax=Marinobacter sp. AL4B TaxID=2871173 RepID=UPI001CAA5059|nr:hypothetical protein [Marinobacter sp. AL4B]MBZ0333206.1 hypothetical protein [Marinobacter sp. AL4B]